MITKLRTQEKEQMITCCWQRERDQCLP